MGGHGSIPWIKRVLEKSGEGPGKGEKTSAEGGAPHGHRLHLCTSLPSSPEGERKPTLGGELCRDSGVAAFISDVGVRGSTRDRQ
jgi:hypothetical protein